MENQDYLTRQLITYIGSKRALLSFIDKGISVVMKKLNKDKLDIFDVFSGSGITARYFKQYASKLIVNDFEDYSRVVNNCYLSNKSDIDKVKLLDSYNYLKSELASGHFKRGFISELYSPQNDKLIIPGERVFYTSRNAAFLDTARQSIIKLDSPFRDLLLAPLLSEASIHTNTAGVFKGFYKNRTTGTGKFGGNKGDALSRILGDIELKYPVFSNFECNVEVLQGDSNKVAPKINEVDLAYLDPPYNQHPYGSNYFMLNLLVNYKKPEIISPVSGIPVDWNRSNFNKKREAFNSFKDLIYKIKAKYLLISFNSEGYISLEKMKDFLGSVGKVEVLETKYNAYRGSRNLRARDIHVKEYLYLVEKR